MSNEKKDVSLKKALGPFQLWVIGVGITISGNYFGWNFGVATSGYGGFLVAIAFMGIMFLTMVYGLCELATVMPYAGGPYAFARRTMGQLPAFLTGLGVFTLYIIAVPIIGLGIGGYVSFLFPQANSTLVALLLYVVFAIVHCIGIGEYAKLETVFTVIALSMLVLLYIVGLPHIETTNLFGASGENLFPGGMKGIWAAFPFAMWLFTGLEMLPMLAEETRNPRVDLPKGNLAAMFTMLCLCFLTTTTVVGLGGMDIIGISEKPLADGVAHALGHNFWLAKLLASVGLIGLIASFSGAMLGFSRQTFALARLGYFPAFLAKVHPTRRTPIWAIIVPSIVGILLVMFVDPDQLILLATFGALISYVMINLSVIILRKKEPNLERPYKMPGFPIVPVISLILACIALFSSIFREPLWFFINVIIFAIAIVYYYSYARHHINYDAPEEASIIANQPKVIANELATSTDKDD